MVASSLGTRLLIALCTDVAMTGIKGNKVIMTGTHINPALQQGKVGLMLPCISSLRHVSAITGIIADSGC